MAGFITRLVTGLLIYAIGLFLCPFVVLGLFIAILTKGFWSCFETKDHSEFPAGMYIINTYHNLLHHVSTLHWWPKLEKHEYRISFFSDGEKKQFNVSIQLPKTPSFVTTSCELDPDWSFSMFTLVQEVILWCCVFTAFPNAGAYAYLTQAAFAFSLSGLRKDRMVTIARLLDSATLCRVFCVKGNKQYHLHMKRRLRFCFYHASCRLASILAYVNRPTSLIVHPVA